MIAHGLDRDIWAICKRYDVRYTRYADDLTFSVARGGIPSEIANPDGAPALALSLVINKNGFRINPSKTRLKTSGHRQTVTGLVVNRRINVDRRYIDRIRGALHAWERYGYECAANNYKSRFRSHASRKGTPSEELAFNIKGRISFVGSIRGRTDRLYLNLLSRFFRLAPELLSDDEKKSVLSLIDTRHLVKNAVFVIDNENSGKAFNQGTAFYLSGIGFVTCAHCIEYGAMLRCPITQKQFRLANVRIHDTHDIAVFDVPNFEPSKYLLPDAQRPRSDDHVMTIGYPSYHPGASVNVAQATVAEERPISGIRYLLLTTGITPGKSGGPVLSSRKQVIGVCQRGGAEGESNDFRVFPIEKIPALLGELKAKDIYEDDQEINEQLAAAEEPQST